MKVYAVVRVEHEPWEEGRRITSIVAIYADEVRARTHLASLKPSPGKGAAIEEFEVQE